MKQRRKVLKISGKPVKDEGVRLEMEEHEQPGNHHNGQQTQYHEETSVGRTVAVTGEGSA